MNVLEGRRALVTGAGTGIGRAIALRLCECGAAVVFHGNSSMAGVMAAVEIARKNGGRASALNADLSNPGSNAKLVRDAVQLLGGLDILVNNCGITYSSPIEETQIAQLDLLYKVNFQSHYLCSQEFIRHKPMRGAAIINISSVHGFGGIAGNSVYAAMKGAVDAFTRQLAIELAERQIRVNAIAPGHIEVERHFGYDGYSSEASARNVPLRRVGTPEDIANLAVFLASGDAGFITGQVIYADGGLTAGLNLPDRSKGQKG